MKTAAKATTDWLSLVAFVCITVLVAIVFYVASNYPGARQLLTTVIVGLGASGLILFRQIRKTTGGLIMSEARAQYVATHDTLTQLPNKALFLDRLRAANQVHTLRGAVLCIGLERFGEVEEALGHGAGEEVIAEIATRLISICPEGDTVARLGDDAFALLWASATLDKAQAVAGHMVKLLSAPCDVSAGRAFVGCAIGVSFLQAGIEPTEVLRQAHLALSHARKLGGEGFSVFEPAMDQALKSRKALESELRQALVADGLAMVYQPQVNARGAMFGVEALMRWTSPERGEISPGVFVPLSESCGLSDELGAFALRSAFSDAKRWPGLKVAINVSAAQVRSGKLLPIIKALLVETGVNPRNFELEITESVLLADDPEIHETLGALRRLGFALALDDFGTGYSSLSYLRRFPIDKIKIDRSFVSHLGMRPESDAIVKAIVDLAGALELKVIAEGVETKAQVDRLALAGCGQIQGFFYSRPVAAEEIDRLVSGEIKLAA